jgi:hypothetical protein
MAGAGKEWLKQSDEKRAAKYQEIRDKRIGEIRKGNITHEYGLRSDEAQRAEKVQSAESEKERGFRKGESELDRKNRLEVEANKPINLSQGETAWNREGKLIARGDPKTFAPNAASQAAKEYEETKVYRRGKGGERGAATTMKELADEWAEQAYVDTVTTDDLGNQIKTKKRNPNFPGLTEYQNQSVTDEYQLEPNSIDQIRRDPARLWQMFQSQPEFSQPGGRENALIKGSTHGGPLTWKKVLLVRRKKLQAEPKSRQNPPMSLVLQSRLARAGAGALQLAVVVAAVLPQKLVIPPSRRDISVSQ